MGACATWSGTSPTPERLTGIHPTQQRRSTLRRLVRGIAGDPANGDKLHNGNPGIAD
jgi:hypothetical protein